LSQVRKKLNEKLSDPAKLEKGESIDQVYQKYTIVQKDLDTEISNWEKLNLEMEALQAVRNSNTY
jgi:hypothetical protein